MENVGYYWAKFCKKIRGSAIKNSIIDKTSKVEAGSTIVNTKFERHSFCGYDCTIINCQIGSFCSIANKVSIGQSSHPMEWVSTSPVFRERKDSVKKKYSEHVYRNELVTNIGNDVWIGENVLIKAGVTIGHGAVIGMGSIVTKDVEPYAIVAGCPAKKIRNRFDDRIIKRLLESRWWEFHDEKLYKYAPFFTNPEKFLDELEREYRK